jgi:hypothetical protein
VEVWVDLVDDVPGTGAQPGTQDLPAFQSKFPASSVSSIRIEAGEGDDQIFIHGTPSGVTTQINAGVGNDIINIGNGNLLPIEGNLIIQGGDYDGNTLNINDQLAPLGNTYTIEHNRFTRSSFPVLTYDASVEVLTLNAGKGADTIDVLSTASGTPVTINAGDRNDVIRITPSSKVLNLDSAVTVHGQDGSDELFVYDSAYLSGTTYTVTSEKVADFYGNEVFYHTMEGVTLNIGSGADTINVESTMLGAPVTINASGGKDTLNFAYEYQEGRVATVAFYGDSGEDAAVLHGTGAVETVRLWPGRGSFKGDGVAVTIRDTETITAHGGGGIDVAMLHDHSDNPDTFQAWPDMARLYGAGFYNRVKSFRWVHGYSRAGGSDRAYLNDSDGNDKFDAWAHIARVYGGGFYNRALDFEEGQAIAQQRDDYDQANAYETTVWEGVGDWEGGNMTPIPPPTGSTQSSWLEEAWAAWAAVDDADEDGSRDSKSHSQEMNPAAIDRLMAKAIH